MSTPTPTHQRPLAVDFDRLRDLLNSRGLGIQILNQGHALGTDIDHIPFLFAFDTTGRFLSIRAIWDTPFHHVQVEQSLFAAADCWNREKYFPTVYWLSADDAHLQICADVTCDTLAGMTDPQLHDVIDVGLETGVDAIRYMQAAAQQTLGWTPNP